MMDVDLKKRDQLPPPPVLLQSQFFTQNNNSNIIKPMKKSYSSCFSTSSDFGSVFSSSMESEQGSTESESDQDNDYMLQDDENVNRCRKEIWNSEWPKLGMKGKFENLHKNEALSKKPTTPNLDFHSKQALIDQQMRIIQLHKVKQEQFMKQQQYIECNRKVYPTKGRVMNGFVNGKKDVQQQHRSRSEMTAVFLGESGSKTGSSGTGVFLPKGTTDPSYSRKKSGCSTVLVPARVLEALKFQFDRLGIEPRFNVATFHKPNDDGMNGKQQFETTQSNQDISLPNEWTY